MQESHGTPSAYIINFDTLKDDIQEMVQQEGLGSSPRFQRYSPPPGGPTAAAAAPPEAPPAPSAPVKTAANGKAKEAHKHQISQAIPRNERDNGEPSRPEAAPASSRSTQGGTQKGTQEGTRKSVRARKPKRN